MRKLIGLLVLALGLLFATAAMANDEAGKSADKAWGNCCGSAQKCCQKSCGCKSKCGSSCGCKSKCGSSCGSKCGSSCGCKSKCGSSCGSKCGSSCGCQSKCESDCCGSCCKCCPRLPTEWPDPCRAGDPNSDWDRDGTSRRNA